MRHLKRGRKFSRTTDQRKALFRTLCAQLILHGRIATSEAKAKEIRPIIEQLLTKAKLRTLAARRGLATDLPHAAAKKLVDVIAPKFHERRGGYTRIVKLPPRPSDSSKRALIEFMS